MKFMVSLEEQPNVYLIPVQYDIFIPLTVIFNFIRSQPHDDIY